MCFSTSYKLQNYDDLASDCVQNILGNVYEVPTTPKPVGLYSVRVINPDDWTGPIVQVKNPEGEVGDVYTDKYAKVVQLSVTSPRVASYYELDEIKNWFKQNEALILKWYDQSGRGLDLNNYGDHCQFRLISDQGDFPAIFITGQ